MSGKNLPPFEVVASDDGAMLDVVSRDEGGFAIRTRRNGSGGIRWQIDRGPHTVHTGEKFGPNARTRAFEEAIEILHLWHAGLELFKEALSDARDKGLLQ